MLNNKSDRKTPKLGKILVVIIILIVASILGIKIPWEEVIFDAVQQTEQHVQSLEGELVLTMIDVGQADSFLLEQNDKIALVDCGTRSTGKDVVEYLQSQNIQKIDYVFGTHPHDDHMGGMYDVITNFEIGKVIIPEVETGKVTTNWYLKLLTELKEGGYKVEHPEVDKIYTLGDATIKVVGPISKPEDNLNNYSTVLKVSFGEMDIIMTGDAEVVVEDEILESGADLDAEILKVGHHGSDTSSSEDFLDAISPEYALISCKVGNKYEHPIKSTMENLQERNIEVYRTDENDTVVATITSNSVKFNCEPGDYLSGTELEERSAK